jgi:hypothetical protein
MLELLKEFWPLLLWGFLIWAGRRKKKRQQDQQPAPAKPRGRGPGTGRPLPGPQRQPRRPAPLPQPEIPGPGEYGGLEAEFQEQVPTWEVAAQPRQAGLKLGPDLAGAVGAAAARLRGSLGQGFAQGLRRRVLGLDFPEGLPRAVDLVVLGLLKEPKHRAELEAVAAELFGREIRAANLEQFVAQAPKMSGIWGGAILADSLGMVLFGRRWAKLRLDSLDPEDNPVHRLDGQRAEALEPPHLLRAQALAQLLDQFGEAGLSGDLMLEAEQRFAPSFQLYLGGLAPLSLRCAPFAGAMTELAQEILTRRFEFLEGATLLEAVDRSSTNPERALREALVVARTSGLAGLPRDQVPALLLEAQAAGGDTLRTLSQNLEGRIRPLGSSGAKGASQAQPFFSGEALLRGVVLGQALRIGRRVGG